MPKLQGDQLRRLQLEFKDAKLLVVDEKSMMGTRMLFMVHSRLCEAFPERANLPFGGVSIVLMGDYAQLPPVLDKPVYDVSRIILFESVS